MWLFSAGHVQIFFTFFFKLLVLPNYLLVLRGKQVHSHLEIVVRRIWQIMNFLWTPHSPFLWKPKMLDLPNKIWSTIFKFISPLLVFAYIFFCCQANNGHGLMKFWLNITPGDTVIYKYEIRLKTVSAGLPCVPKNVHFECLEVCELGVCVACHPAVAICLVLISPL